MMVAFRLAAEFIPVATQDENTLRASMDSNGFELCGYCVEITPPIQKLA